MNTTAQRLDRGRKVQSSPQSDASRAAARSTTSRKITETPELFQTRPQMDKRVLVGPGASLKAEGLLVQTQQAGGCSAGLIEPAAGVSEHLQRSARVPVSLVGAVQ